MSKSAMDDHHNYINNGLHPIITYIKLAQTKFVKSTNFDKNCMLADGASLHVLVKLLSHFAGSLYYLIADHIPISKSFESFKNIFNLDWKLIT